MKKGSAKAQLCSLAAYISVFLLGNEWNEKDYCLCGEQWRSNRSGSVSEYGVDPK